MRGRRRRPGGNGAAIALALALSAAAGRAGGQTPEPVHPPQVLEHVDPEYPPSQLDRGAEADVVVLVVVEKDGTVGEVTIAESGGPEFDRALARAVKRWRFAPATKGGVPVRSRIRIPFHFAPGPHPSSPSEGEPGSGEEPPSPTDVSSEGIALPHAVEEPGRPIEIHVQGRPSPARRAASDFRIDRRVLDAAPSRRAADLLRTAPGFVVTQPEGEAVAPRLYLRGFDAEHGQDVSLNVGPVPLNQPSHIHGQGYADLGVVIPETVRSLRVLEGVYDPEQRDFTVAGSADFDLGVETRGALLKGAYGSFGTGRAVAVYAPEGHAEETFAAASYTRTSGFGAARGGESGAATGQYRFDLADEAAAQLHFAAYGGRSQTAGVLRRDDVEAGRVGFYDAYPDPTARSQGAASSRFQVAASFERQRDDGSALELSLWASQSDYRSRLNFTGYLERSRERPSWTGRGDLIEQTNDDSAFGGRAVFRSPRLKPLSWMTARLSLGLDARTHGIEQAQNLLQAPQNETWDRRVDASTRVTDVGVFGDAALSLGKYARLRGGLRADLLAYDVDDRLGNFIPAFQKETHLPGFRRNASGLALGPRATFEVDPSRWLRLTAAYGEGYRSPQARQLEEGEGAPFSRVRSYEVGARVLELGRAGREVSATVALYETRLSYDLAFDATEGALDRIGPTTRRGVALHFFSALGRAFVASASLTATRATLDEPPPPTPENPNPPFREGQLLPFVPPVVVRTDLSHERLLFPLAGSPVLGRIGAGTTFLSSRPLPYGQAASPVFLVDALASLRRGVVEFGVEAQNLLDLAYADTEYAFVSDWRTRPIPSALPARHFSAGPPRVVLGTLTLHL